MKASIGNIISRLENNIKLSNQLLLDEIQENNNKLEVRKKVANDFLIFSPGIEKVLVKAGLVIMQNNLAIGVRNISLRLASTGKFKFVSFDGYTSSGSGRNRKKLEAKARKIEKIIEDVCEYKCCVNEFSIEASKKSSRESVVMCDLYIKE